jgi:hypothetical protein
MWHNRWSRCAQWPRVTLIERVGDDVLRFAQQAGFTVEEIKNPVPRIRKGRPIEWALAGTCTRQACRARYSASAFRVYGGALELSLKCGCVRIEDCTLIGNW